MLFYIQLLQLNPPIIERCAEHDCLGRAIAPGQPGQFAPKRGGHPVGLGKISAKSEVAGAEQAADAVGESESFRSLLERNVGRSAGDFPIGMLGTPFVRNGSANLSAERVRVELQSHALVPQSRQICRSGLQVQALS